MNSLPQVPQEFKQYPQINIFSPVLKESETYFVTLPIGTKFTATVSGKLQRFTRIENPYNHHRSHKNARKLDGRKGMVRLSADHPVTIIEEVVLQ